MPATPLDTTLKHDTFGHADVRHPYAHYCLSEAVRLARGIALVREQPMDSLVQARTMIAAAARCGGIWLTGVAALDVLDLAIDGRDLATDCRVLGPQPSAPRPLGKRQVTVLCSMNPAWLSSRPKPRAAALATLHSLEQRNFVLCSAGSWLLTLQGQAVKASLPA
jgi:hypothetical protein